MSKEGRRNAAFGLAYIGFPGRFLFLASLRPMYQIASCSKKAFVFFPPENSNVGGSAKWAQISKNPNNSVLWVNQTRSMIRLRDNTL